MGMTVNEWMNRFRYSHYIASIDGRFFISFFDNGIAANIKNFFCKKGTHPNVFSAPEQVNFADPYSKLFQA